MLLGLRRGRAPTGRLRCVLDPRILGRHRGRRGARPRRGRAENPTHRGQGIWQPGRPGATTQRRSRADSEGRRDGWRQTRSSPGLHCRLSLEVIRSSDDHRPDSNPLPSPALSGVRPMRLAFSTNAYMRFPFEEAAARIRALGYDGLELMADVPHAWPNGLLPDRKRAIREAMERHDLKFSNVNAFMMNAINDHRQPYWYPSFLEADEGYRRVRIDPTRRALSLCAEMGAPHITTEPGGPLGPGDSRQAAIDRFVEALKPLAEHAQSLGVLLLVEPEPGLLIETTDQYL